MTLWPAVRHIDPLATVIAVIIAAMVVSIALLTVV